MKQSDLVFPCQSEPDNAASAPVCEGIRWFRQSLPFVLDHVNCWLLGEPGNQVLVDTGVANESTRTQWLAGLGRSSAQPAGEPVQPLVETLLVTHFHPDHMGLAAWFRQSGCQLVGSAIEAELAQLLWQAEDQAYGSSHADWYALNGLPQATVEAVRSRANTYRKLVLQPPESADWTYLHDGQCIDLGGHEYRVIVGRGHAPHMLMLYRDADHVLIAADQVLPSISPNVSVMPRLQDQNPLQSFLSTLDALKALPDDTLVLPSHGQPFIGLHQRLDQLQAHHDLRLAEVLTACSEPRSAYDLFEVLFRRPLDAQQTSFALGESLAHLYYLESIGKLERDAGDRLVKFCQT